MNPFYKLFVLFIFSIPSMLQIYTDSAEAKIPAVMDYLGTVIEVYLLSTLLLLILPHLLLATDCAYIRAFNWFSAAYRKFLILYHITPSRLISTLLNIWGNNDLNLNWCLHDKNVIDCEQQLTNTNIYSIVWEIGLDIFH